MSEQKQDEKKIKSIKSFTNNFYLLKIIWKICPSRLICEFIYDICDFGGWAFMTVVFMKYLFGAAEIQRSFEEITIFIIYTTIGFMIIIAYSEWYSCKFAPMTSTKIYFELNKILFEKATNVDVACYENPSFYDTYTKANTEAFIRAESVIKNMGVIICSLLSSIYVMYTMFSINVIAGLFTFLPVIGNFFFGKLSNKYYYKRDMDNIPHKRKQDYVNRTVYLQKFAKEIRLTGIFSILKTSYKDSVVGINKNTEKYWKRLFFIDATKNTICFPLVFEGLWLFAAYSAMVTKTILIGDFVILSSAIVSTTWLLIELTEAIVKSYNNGLYINNLKEFLNYEAAIKEDQDGLPVGKEINILELKDVCFTYQGQEKAVLENINITVKCGEKIALVGHNGAGKTTIVKLIMRLYDPTSGVILLNGIDIKEYNLKEYRNLMGTTFQDFQMFSMSVIENVLMKQIDSEDERNKAMEALKESGVYDKINSLDNKFDSILTREFDDNGVVLSGGESQKIAVARAFYKDSPIVILDEPSSALDPIAEYEMYETIMKLCDSNSDNKQDKLAIIISHRLSSAAMADNIYLLEHGNIIESGTHGELMKLDKIYADMFKKQAENYLVSNY